MTRSKNQARFFQDADGMHLVFETMPHGALIASLAKLVNRQYQQVTKELQDDTFCFDPSLFVEVKARVLERSDLFEVIDPDQEERKQKYQETYGPPLAGSSSREIEEATRLRERLLDQWLAYVSTFLDPEERIQAEEVLARYREHRLDASAWLALNVTSPDIMLGIRDLRFEKQVDRAKQAWQKFQQAQLETATIDIDEEQAEALLSIASFDERERGFRELDYGRQHALYRYALSRCQQLGFQYQHGWNTDLTFAEPTPEQRRYLAAAGWIFSRLDEERKRIADLFPGTDWQRQQQHPRFFNDGEEHDE